MFSGDEFYDDEITAGQFDGDPATWADPNPHIMADPEPKVPYLCPVCGRLPHWTAVVLAYAALRQRGNETREQYTLRARPAITSLSADICQRNPAQL